MCLVQFATGVTRLVPLAATDQTSVAPAAPVAIKLTLASLDELAAVWARIQSALTLSAEVNAHGFLSHPNLDSSTPSAEWPLAQRTATHDEPNGLV